MRLLGMLTLTLLSALPACPQAKIDEDLGQWINHAIAALPGNGAGGSYGCGVVKVPYSSVWIYSTPIIKPRCTLLDLNQSTLEYRGPNSSPAISVYDSFAVSQPAPGGIINGRLLGGNGVVPVKPGVGIMMGGLGERVPGFCATNKSPSDCSATFQNFMNLEVQNFDDGWRFGSNTYMNTWNGVTIAGNTNALHFLSQNNSNENQNFHGVNFINNISHDILVDSNAYAEVMCDGCSFDYSGSHSISGPIHFFATGTHNENSHPGVHWFDCSGGGCSIHITGGSSFLLGRVTPKDAFGVFGGSNNQITFDGVEWGVAPGNMLSQFLIWNDSSPLSSLHFNHFRQAFFGPLTASSSQREVPVINRDSRAKPIHLYTDASIKH